MKATFFSSGGDLRRWLEEHSARSTELWVGYFKAGSSCDLVGRQCKEGRNAQTAAEAIDRGFLAQTADKAVSEPISNIAITVARID
jgi:hypothetical protein